MSILDYKDAHAKGQKEYRDRVSKGQYPYLQVLDDILLCAEIVGEEPLGLVDIPIDHIVGTKTAGRTNAFAANFMPLIDEGSEFSTKWANLATSHIEEGIRDPIVAYEYMNRFYVVEGNKRVSVMKYFGALTIPGTVRRVVPKPQDSDESKIYYAFMDFYKLTKVNYIWFSQPARFRALLGEITGEPRLWTDDDRSEFTSAYYRFRKIFKEMGGGSLPGTTADAFLAYIKIYGIRKIRSETDSELRESLRQSRSELSAYSGEKTIELALAPNQTNTQPSFLSKLLLPWKSDTLRVLLVYDTLPETSSWSHAHDEGRKAAEKFFDGKILFDYKPNVNARQFADVIKKAAENHTDVVFTASSKLLPACLTASVQYPDIKFLNCSIYTPHPTMRSYYGRMYEVKFLAGVMAGAMTQTHNIGYFADYPIYGTVAAVNAFAKGARMTDPEAKIHVRWSCLKEKDVWNDLVSCGADMIAGLDSRSPVDAWRAHGLYKVTDGVGKQLCTWQVNWGRFYIRIIQEILNGTWKGQPSKDNPKAVNYWWGLSAGIFDIAFADDIPADTLQLASILKRDIIAGRVAFFDRFDLTHEEIIRMNAFAENVVGTIPDLSELTDDAKELLKYQGLYSELREDSI